MKIADLFIQLGIKGQKDTTSALKDIKTGMGEIALAAGTAVAALTAGFYAFKEFGKQSNQVGLQLDRFQTLTGMSADKLQAWQLLALKSGATAEDMATSLQKARDVISTMVLGKGLPAGLGALVNTPGVKFDVRQARDLDYVISKIQEYARVTKNLPEAQHIMDSMGFSRTIQYALMQGGIPSKAGPAHAYSKSEIKALKDMQIEWTLLGDKIDHAVGHLNARFSPSLLKDINKLTDSLLRLVTALSGLADKLKVFSEIGKVSGAIANALSFLSNPSKSGAASAVFNSHPLTRLYRAGAAAVTHHTSITVQGAHDPELTAKIVKKHLDNQNNSALRSLPQSIP